MTTGEPIIGIGAYTGQRHFIVGEDATGDGRPDAERLTISPLHRPAQIRAFGPGGNVDYEAGGPGGISSPPPPVYVPPPTPTPIFEPEAGGGVGAAPPPVVEPSPITPPIATPTSGAGPGGPTPELAPPGSNVPPFDIPPVIGPGGGPIAGPPSGGVGPLLPPRVIPPSLPTLIPDFNALDPNILNPFQDAIARLNWEDRMRNVYNYRFAAGGLPSATGISVLPGQNPTQELPNGMFYDWRPQTNQAIADITNRQRELGALGAIEDTAPVQDRLTFISNTLDDLNRIRDLENARVAAVAGGNVPGIDTTSIEADIQSRLTGLLSIPPGPKRQEAEAALASLQSQLERIQFLNQQAGSGSADRTSVIDAQIADLRNRTQGMTEEQARTELAQLQQRLNRNTSRINLTSEVQNLAKAGIPPLSGSRVTYRTAA